jgi:hypothetical protein
MTKLQALIKLRGVPVNVIAREERVGYHALQKTVKGVQKTRPMLRVIARHLGLSAHALLGRNADTIITHLIEGEIEKHAEELRRELRRLYLESEEAS